MPKGNCYEVHVRFLRENVDDVELDDWRLCHGTVTNAQGVALGHCWLESNGFAYDFSNGNTFRSPVATFREVTAASGVTEYTSEEVSVNIIRSGHYGPWK